MQAGLKNAYESIKAFSETDFTEDLKKFDVPTLVTARSSVLIVLRPSWSSRFFCPETREDANAREDVRETSRILERDVLPI
jgi:hypothetical protein